MKTAEEFLTEILGEAPNPGILKTMADACREYTKQFEIQKDMHPKDMPEMILMSRDKYLILENRADQYQSLIRKIEEHQGNEFDEETESFIDNPDCNLETIGELVLTELDLWR